MMVKMIPAELNRNGHRGLISLLVGTENVQQHFAPGTMTVELELDHVRIVCTLEPSFWQDRPEIRDYRLSSWLEGKRSSGKTPGTMSMLAAPVALVAGHDRTFRLQAVVSDEAPIKEEPAGKTTAALNKPFASPTTTVNSLPAISLSALQPALPPD